MQLGMIGLGRMEANMVRRLMKGGHQCVIYDRNVEAVQTLAREGGTGDIPRTPNADRVGTTAEEGYVHCGPPGAGHFVKMVHNGIEYGIVE